MTHHEALHNAILVIDDFGYGGQAVGGAGGIAMEMGRHISHATKFLSYEELKKLGNEMDVSPDDIHGGWVILLLIYSHDKHGSVGRGGGDYDLLGSACQVGGGLLYGGENTSRLDDNFGSVFPPRKLCRISPGVCVCVCVCECVWRYRHIHKTTCAM